MQRNPNLCSRLNLDYNISLDSEFVAHRLHCKKSKVEKT